MAVVRNEPYLAQNFLVDMGDGDDKGADGAFAEVSGLETWLEIAEYRTGNAAEKSRRKLPGMAKVGDVTLKRGIVGSLRLYQWFDAARDGDIQRRNITITLLDEARQPVVAWKLVRAQPVRYAVGTLNANASEIAIEELVLAYERLEMG